MSLELGKFQMTEVTDFAGLITENQIDLMFGNKPQLLTSVIHKFLAGSGVNNLSTVLERFPMETLDEEEDFLWKLKGNDEKNVPLVYAYVTAGTTITDAIDNNGINGEEVVLVFQELYFSDVNVLVGPKNEVYQFRVVADPTEEGDGWHYRTKLMGSAKLTGVPGEELVAGTRFSKDFSPVEDKMSMKGGDITFTSPIDMRNGFTTLRMEHKVPGKLLDKRVAGTIVGTDANGATKEFTAWMLYTEWEFDKQWSKEKSRGYMFARSNRNEDGSYSDLGKSGFYIKQGAGIREQMEVSNVTFSDDISIELLESILTDLVEGREDTDSVADFMIRTGRRGATSISKAAAADASGWVSLNPYNPQTIQKVTSSLHSNSFTGGFQFTEYLMPNNIRLKVEVDSMYDDKVRNKILHPKGGVAESYRLDIFFVGSDKAPNIKRLGTKRGDIRGYMAGFRNPWTGEINNQHMGTMEDSATYSRYGHIGAAIIDSSRTATILPTMLA